MIYEYECNNCRKDVELDVPMAMRDTPRCPTCHFTLVRKVPPSKVALYISPNFYTENKDVLPKDGAEKSLWRKEGAEPHPDRYQSK